MIGSLNNINERIDIKESELKQLLARLNSLYKSRVEGQIETLFQLVPDLVSVRFNWFQKDQDKWTFGVLNKDGIMDKDPQVIFLEVDDPNFPNLNFEVSEILDAMQYDTNSIKLYEGLLDHQEIEVIFEYQRGFKNFDDYSLIESVEEDSE